MLDPFIIRKIREEEERRRRERQRPSIPLRYEPPPRRPPPGWAPDEDRDADEEDRGGTVIEI